MQAPIPNAELLYEDPDAAKALRVLPKVLEKVECPVCDHQNPIPGLPVIPDRWPEWVVHESGYLAKTPWGLADMVGNGTPWGLAEFLGDLEGLEGNEMYAINPIWRIVVPEGHYPGAVMPAPGTAVLELTGMVSIYTDGCEEPVHHLRLDLDRDGWNLMRIIRRHLCHDGIPVYPTAIYATAHLPYPYPLVTEDRLAPVARVANKEVGVPLVGYAVAPNEEVIYLNIVGHKTAVRSIWATLNGRAGNTVRLSAPPDAYCRAYSSSNYVTYSDTVADGLARLVIVDRRAVDKAVDSEAYLIAPTTADLDLDRAFAARLDATLPLPILPEWGSVLRAEGEKNRLVKPCRFGGDVGLALAIVPDVGRWQALIEGLVQSGELTW